MSYKDEGGPAFPEPGLSGLPVLYGRSGMSLRDYFAAQALSSLMRPGLIDDSIDEVVRQAYVAADKMIRKKKGL